VFNYAKWKYTHIRYIYSEPGQVQLAYVVSVIDYNISLFRTASRSNYAINVQLRKYSDGKLQKVSGRCLILSSDHYVFSSKIVRGKNLVTVSSYTSATSHKNFLSSRDRLWLFRRSDYNISLFRTASRSNYAIIEYTMLQSPGIWNFPLASKAH
jgi:hypothetical protein